MTAREQVALPVDGYETNAEFLKAKYEEVALQLECAGLRGQLRQWDRPWSTGLCGTSQETMWSSPRLVDIPDIWGKGGCPHAQVSSPVSA